MVLIIREAICIDSLKAPRRALLQLSMRCDGIRRLPLNEAPLRKLAVTLSVEILRVCDLRPGKDCLRDLGANEKWTG